MAKINEVNLSNNQMIAARLKKQSILNYKLFKTSSKRSQFF